MTAIPKPSSLANSLALVYDAWNRLVEVKDGANTVAKYEYDGRNYRIVKSVYAGGMLDHDEHYYYNESWQVLEVRRDSETTPHEQYFWHTYYIDALALQCRAIARKLVLLRPLFPLDGGSIWPVLILGAPRWSFVIRGQLDNQHEGLSRG